MREVQYITMLTTKEQQTAIKAVFKQNNWGCYLKVLSDVTVTVMIKNGFACVFPLCTGSEGDGEELSTLTESDMANTEVTSHEVANTEVTNHEVANTEVASAEMASSVYASDKVTNTGMASTVVASAGKANTEVASAEMESTVVASAEKANTEVANTDVVGDTESEAGSCSDSSDTIEMDNFNVSEDIVTERLDEHKQDKDNKLNTARTVTTRGSNRRAAMSRNSVLKSDSVSSSSVKKTDNVSKNSVSQTNKISRNSFPKVDIISINSDAKAESVVRQRRSRNRTQFDRQGYNRVLECIDCKKKVPSLEELWHHRNEVKHVLPAKNVRTKFNLEMYTVEEHKQMGFIKCDGCDNYFLGKRRQMKHFYAVHRDMMPTPTCPICCKEFKSHAELLRHKREEGHKDSLSSLNNYQCDLCGKHMTSYSNFVQHKKLVCGIGEKEMEKIRIHACDICGKLFKSQRHVRRHKKMSHFKVPEVCDICGMVYQGRKALNVHKKRHDVSNKKHRCSDCGKAFFSDSKLQEHIRTHTKEKPFKCPLCTYTCAVKPNIQKHATNVHKQTVAVVDLRKMQKDNENVSDGNSNRVHVENIQERNVAFTRNKTIQNFNVSQFHKSMEENSQISVELQAQQSSLHGNELNLGVQGKCQVNVEHAFMSNQNTSTCPYSELNRATDKIAIQHKTIPTAYIGKDCSKTIQIHCDEREGLYYSEQREEAYIPHPNDINLGQYQVNIN